MASQTVMTLCSSFTPKLATFNSPTPTLLPLPPRSFSCSSSLPTPCLKASYGGIGVRQTSRDFKCYASESDNELHAVISTPGVWYEIPEVLRNEEVQRLGDFTVKYNNNEEGSTKLTFVRVIKAQSQVVGGINYNLWIEVREGEGAKDGVPIKVYEAFVFISPPVLHKEVKDFREFV